MDKDVKLTKDELSVLKVCNEEPGKLEMIKRELKDKLSKEKIKEILDRLLKLELVYQDDGWWALTVEGGRELNEELSKNNTPPNYWGERINKKFIEKAIEKIRKLPKEKIDELVYKFGWLDSEKGKNKSLPDYKLELIKSNKQAAEQALTDFFQECPKKEFIEALKEIES